MLTVKQLQRHNDSITASKIAAILNISPWGSAYSIYREMKGEVQRVEQTSMRTLMGNYMEEAIHSYCTKELLWTLAKVREEGICHKDYPYIWCLPDRFKLEHNSGGAIPEMVVEFKNVDSMFYRDWKDNGVPDHYKAQVHFQSLVSGLPGVLVACFGGNTIETYDFPRNEEIEGFLLQTAIDFWQRLLIGDPPPIDGSSHTAEALSRMFPSSRAGLVEGTDDTLNLLKSLVDIGKQIAPLELKQEEIKNTLKAQIGSFEGLMWKNGSKVTWKLSKDSKVLDNDAVLEKHPDVYKECLKDKPGSRRFLYSLKGAKDE